MQSGIFDIILSPEVLKMKKLVTLILFTGLLWSANAQTDSVKADLLQLRETEHDFGQIPQGKPVFYFFDISNLGTTALKLDNVQASCGCTTPEWNREPIPAGGADKIKVGYNAANEGVFDKFITVTYNGNQTKQIHIKGTVWRAPAGPAPTNASLQILKQQNQ